MSAGEDSRSVTFVSSHAMHGGSERYLMILLRRLNPEWVHGVVSLQEGPMVDELRAAGFRVDTVATPPSAAGMLGAVRRLRALLRDAPPDVVHANGLKAAIVTALATLGTRIPFVWVKHDVAFDRRLAPLVALRAARIVAVSSSVVSVFGPRARRKVAVVHNAIPDAPTDRAAGREAVRAALGGETPEHVVAVVGRLDPYKGQAELVAVAPDLAARVPGVRVLLVGGRDPARPEHEDELRREVERQGLGEVVRFLGHRTDAQELIAGSDVLVMATVPDASGLGREAFPYVGLEALAAGTPVVAYAEGGLPEQVGPCGILVPPRDRAELLESIVRLLEDEQLRDELGSCGRERAAREFGLDRLVAAMQEHYRAVAR